MKLVLDASMALAWIFERDKPEEKRTAEQVLTLIREATVLVPSLWHTEIANVLLLAERRKVATEAQVIDYLNKLLALPITTEENVTEHREQVMALAREYQLTAYDATYLALALREDSILATFDRKLADAMQRAGGKVFN